MVRQNNFNSFRLFLTYLKTRIVTSSITSRRSVNNEGEEFTLNQLTNSYMEADNIQVFISLHFYLLSLKAMCFYTDCSAKNAFCIAQQFF